MKRYFCNGKKGYCDRGNDNNIDCSACEFADGTGGEIVDCPDTVYEAIKGMSVKEMALFFAEKIMQQEKYKLFVEENSNITATQASMLNKEIFMQCLRWLESEVEQK